MAVGGDCRDDDPDVHPETTEICNGVDDDCDGDVDEDDPDVVGVPTWYTDADGDGWGVESTAQVVCDAPEDGVLQPGDCDDTVRAVHADAEETCDGRDDDCDGKVDDDDDDVVGALAWYADGDADGFGAGAALQTSCEPPAGAPVTNDLDCADDDPSIHPGADEVCDGVDDDCDGDVDDEDDTVIGAPSWYLDADGDGWGGSSTLVYACEPPGESYESSPLDCLDSDSSVHPGAAEVCNDADDDCDGDVDDEDDDLEGGGRWFVDSDGDDAGDEMDAGTVFCSDPGDGWSDSADDCDDGRPEVNPSMSEVCNGLDDDCDGETDDEDPDVVDRPTWYPDGDGDGWGIPASTQVSCARPEGWATAVEDCRDDDASINPGVAEVPNDGIDNDCDGSSLPFPELLTADLTWVGRTGTHLGVDMAEVGDVDGDGCDDLLAAAPLDTGPEGTWNGVAWVLSGCGGPSRYLFNTLSIPVDGWVVAPSGDFDGDADRDLLVHLRAAQTTFWVPGPIGSDVDLLTAATWTSTSPVGDRCLVGGLDLFGDGQYDDFAAIDGGLIAYLWIGHESPVGGFLPSTPDRIGPLDGWTYPTVAAGDVTGDGIDDLAFGMPDAGSGGIVRLFAGPFGGDLSVDSALAVFESGEPLAEFGYGLAIGADFTGDGLGDLVIGAPNAGGGTGRIWVIDATALDLPSAVAVIEGVGAGTGFGEEIAAADLNGDDVAELLVGMPGLRVGVKQQAGGVFLFIGPVTGTLEVPGDANAAWLGSSAYGWGGTSLVAGGDYDHDGTPDFAFAVPGHEEATGIVPRVHAIHGLSL